ncbi:MAG: hypothetical protein JO317_04390, partial [Verrucomicrobiae bacterium]|nr:hypothetical protein [Verrucomicrobiae bacterium]
MFVFLQLLIRAFLAPAVFLFDRRHRHVVLRNLRIAMPELTSEERHDLAVQSFEQFFVNLLTHLVKIDLNNVEIVGQERLEECKREGRGAV